ncbi:tyrosine-type recombinase/integrase [Burkholderia cepacia]|uniref:tyrosine-type recombinase/integrase n=1 Tax=Burkholderia cepacia TaxID=292 RepID=UPI000F5D5EC8|nr:tyrosine-type recombinase/integrase [Burkholderia cepacia]
MNDTLGIPASLSPAEEPGVSRNRALLQVAAESIQHLDESGVINLQHILEHGNEYGCWETPKRWRPVESRYVMMRIVLRQRIIDLLPERLQQQALDDARQLEDSQAVASVARPHILSQSHISRVLDLAVLTFTRYLLLLRLGPSSQAIKGASLDPSTISTLAYDILAAMFAKAAANLLASPSVRLRACSAAINASEVGFLRHMSKADMESLSESKQKRVIPEVRRMQSLADRGFWGDIPNFGQDTSATTDVAGEKKQKAPQKDRDSHRPLPDDYVSEMGRRSVWLIKDLAPNLLTIAGEIVALWARTDNGTDEPDSVLASRRKLLPEYLANFVWRDSRGQVFSEPPFQIKLSGNTNAKVRKRVAEENLHWPPRSFTHILGLLNNVQMAHLFAVSLSTGGRKSETLTLQRDCIEYARNGMPYANGRTFKLVKRHDGQLRDWVLPDLAVEAIEQQVRMVSLIESIGLQLPDRSTTADDNPVEPPRHLWVQVSSGSHSDRTSPFVNLEKALKVYAKTLGMDTVPGGQNIRPHRLRKTVARLVALALTQAPKILMDVFGHKSIEMTLYYILTDKDLQAEIETVSRELRVIRAKEAVEKMVAGEDQRNEALPLGGYGGPAALMVNRAIQVHEDRLHQRGEDWGADSPMELAEILTLQGKAWQLVRPGVICTKFAGTESGPCNKSKGHPEPSRCQSYCKHRLEEPFLREDVDGAIRDSVQAYVEAGEGGEELVQALWAGQVRAHVSRFEDLRHKWMGNPVVRSIVEESEQEEVAA